MKIITLILSVFIFIVGCSEYSSITECKVKERQKIVGEISFEDKQNIENYCYSLSSKKCDEEYLGALRALHNYSEGGVYNHEYSKECRAWFD
tara:strand:+ start:1095 stop:1370 length:276 start_codon:yes stop_codon:yes gene_type:complete